MGYHDSGDGRRADISTDFVQKETILIGYSKGEK